MNIYDTIISSVNDNYGEVFFLYGYGRTGKTFIWRVIHVAIRSKGDIVLTVSLSEISSLLIPGGRTVQSRFAIPINIIENSTCRIKPDDPLAELIVKSKLIIWDKAHMIHKHCFEDVDKSFMDILRISNPRSMNLPFGEKVVVLDGDFRQILLVIPKGTRQDIVHASINSSYFWQFCVRISMT
ncbi:uncharacterized protein LOC127136315 [Lathyrus oleraceus]|uniref:uncharacterized protein LOC127136315 n=1 Tax=Pisum sativum TaxID=3888 RepID=UPI0021CE9F54|nr:uncharacterized protein LOC127136315 [Pisum sativum]